MALDVETFARTTSLTEVCRCSFPPLYRTSRAHEQKSALAGHNSDNVEHFANTRPGVKRFRLSFPSDALLHAACSLREQLYVGLIRTVGSTVSELRMSRGCVRFEVSQVTNMTIPGR